MNIDHTNADHRPTTIKRVTIYRLVDGKRLPVGSGRLVLSLTQFEPPLFIPPDEVWGVTVDYDAVPKVVVSDDADGEPTLRCEEHGTDLSIAPCRLCMMTVDDGAPMGPPDLHSVLLLACHSVHRNRVDEWCLACLRKVAKAYAGPPPEGPRVESGG